MSNCHRLELPAPVYVVLRERRRDPRRGDVRRGTTASHKTTVEAVLPTRQFAKQFLEEQHGIADLDEAFAVPSRLRIVKTTLYDDVGRVIG